MVTVFGDLYLYYQQRGQVGNALHILHLAGVAGFGYDISRYIEIGLPPDIEFEEFVEEGDHSPDDYKY